MNKGKITILFDYDKTRIEIKDEKSGVMICECEMTQDQTMRVLSRQALVSMDYEHGDLSLVGKRMIHTPFKFVFKDENITPYKNRKEEAYKQACELLEGTGWVPDRGFSSQDSFSYEDGVQYAQCLVRTWIEPDEDEEKIKKELD